MASILRQVQDQVAAQLRESEALSACPVYAEDQKDLEFQIKNALGRQGLVLVVATPKATYMGKLDDTSIAWQLDELEIDAVENPPVNRGRKEGYLTGQEAAMKAFEILCPVEGAAEGQICPVRYEQGQDQGLLVSRAVFKCLVTSDEQPGPEPTPQIKKWFVKLLDEAPADGTALQNGWMWQTEDGFVVVKDGVAHNLGVSFDEMSSYVDSATSAFLSAEDVQLRDSYYAPLQTWKVVEDTAVKTSDGNLFMPDGSVFALSSLELDVDGNLSSVQLSATPQYNVDGKGHYTYIGLAYMTDPQPFYFQTADGTTLELGFNVDGDGTYSVVVGDPAAGQVIVAQQPQGEPVPECDLEFDYGGSRCKVKATNMYAKASDLNTFVREFLGVPDDGSIVPTLLQLMEVSASLENYLPLSGGQMSGDITLGKDNQIVFGSNEDGTVVLQDPSEADFGIHLSTEEDGEIAYQSKYIFSDTYSGFNVVEPTEEGAEVIRSGDLYTALSSKADARSLSNYLPLSGGETTGTVMVPQLSANSSVVVGDPNIGSLGPNETGQHLSGVLITDGGVLDLQGKWITDNTWHKVVIDPLGQITQFRFEGLPLQYDVLQLPRTRTGGFPKTIATQEWTSRNYTKISAMTEDEYEQITPDPTTLYVITED